MTSQVLTSHLAGLGIVTIITAPDCLRATIRTTKSAAYGVERKVVSLLGAHGAEIAQEGDTVTVTVK